MKFSPECSLGFAKPVWTWPWHVRPDRLGDSSDIRFNFCVFCGSPWLESVELKPSQADFRKVGESWVVQWSSGIQWCLCRIWNWNHHQRNLLRLPDPASCMGISERSRAEQRARDSEMSQNWMIWRKRCISTQQHRLSEDVIFDGCPFFQLWVTFFTENWCHFPLLFTNFFSGPSAASYLRTQRASPVKPVPSKITGCPAAYMDCGICRCAPATACETGCGNTAVPARLPTSPTSPANDRTFGPVLSGFIRFYHAFIRFYHCF